MTGEDISEQDLGGSKIHTTKSGVGDYEVKNDAECIARVKRVPLVLPVELRRAAAACCPSPIRSTAARSRCSICCRRTRGAPTTCTSSSGGRGSRQVARSQAEVGAQRSSPASRASAAQPVGIVANQPNHLGGILDVDSSDKAARFMQICDAFNIPLVFLQDVPGFMIGSKVEHEGIIRHGAKMLHVMAPATVPKITVVVRRPTARGIT
jgi:acetyl-CoA carboxylase carboxyltransferase component